MKGIDMNVARMGVGVAGAMGRARRRWPRFVGCVPAAEKVASSSFRAMVQKLTDPRCPQDAQRAAVFGLLREEVLEMSLESLQGDVEAFRSECLDVMVVLARAYAEAERFVGQTKEGQKDE